MMQSRIQKSHYLSVRSVELVVFKRMRGVLIRFVAWDSFKLDFAMTTENLIKKVVISAVCLTIRQDRKHRLRGVCINLHINTHTLVQTDTSIA